jgi:threonine/homoserine/homoserine lactone efflux protein
VRITLSAQFWLYWIAIFAICWYSSPPTNANDVCGIATFPAIHWAISGLIASTEPEKLSRRIRRGLPNRRWARTLLAPFLPGASRGYLYTLLHIAAMWVMVMFVFPLFVSVSSSSRFGPVTSWLGEAGAYTTALCCYLVIYLGLAAFLSRIAQRMGMEIKPGAVDLSPS